MKVVSSASPPEPASLARYPEVARERPLRGAAADRLEAPGQGRARSHDHDEQFERDGDLGERRAVEPARCDPGEQHRLRQDEQRGRDRQRGVHDEQAADGPRALEQARVEAAHGRAYAPDCSGTSAGCSASSTPSSRARNTWYVHPW